MTVAKKPAPKRAVDIFNVLKQIDQRDEGYYDELHEKQQSSLHPLVLTRWMSGTSDPAVILMLNATNNKYNFILAKHKPLLMRMLLVSASGRPRRYNWIAKTKEENLNKLSKVIQQYYKCSPKEAAMYAEIHTADEIIQMAEELGMQSDDIKALKK